MGDETVATRSRWPSAVPSEDTFSEGLSTRARGDPSQTLQGMFPLGERDGVEFFTKSRGVARQGWITKDPSEGGVIQGVREAGGCYWSLNIAMAVPPAVMLTDRDLVAPEGGVQLTE